MKFSNRTAWNLSENDLAHALRIAREGGREILDLTVSNPTTCGFGYPTDLLAPLSAVDAVQYSPDPFGMVRARRAVVDYYRDFGADVSVDRVALTTSTSEAYSYLFRLVCDPGDEVLVPQPSYPLFDFIASLDDVSLRSYPLYYDPNADTSSSWSIDLEGVAAAITPRTRAIILVHPNNPTGQYVSGSERKALCQLCRARNLALIVDEVFLDYSLGEKQSTFAVSESPCLTFVLSGLSKVCALPQMKCSWIVASGPEDVLRESLGRLEVIADTFLSMNAPIQYALPVWLGQRGAIQEQILTRMRANLAALDVRLEKTSAHRFVMQGGWTAVIRVPRTIDGVAFGEATLERGVLVQPGEFYGFPAGRAVLSLLTPPDMWERGLARLPID